METQSILYSLSILGIPVMYWIIMVGSHAIHIYMSIEKDLKSNKEALKVYETNRFKQIGIVIGLVQSSILLIIGWDSYMYYKAHDPAMDISLYIGVGVAFIGYGGSSLWGSIMDIVRNRFNKAADEKPD